MNKEKLLEVLEKSQNEYKKILFDEHKDEVEQESGRILETPDDVADEIHGWDFTGQDDLSFTDGILTGLDIAFNLIKYNQDEAK